MRKMREELEVAAKNTMWLHFGLRAVYFGDEYGLGNSMEKTIFCESLWCGYHTANAVIDGLCKDCDLTLLNLRWEYILMEYFKEYPELCLILCFLCLSGPLSPIGLSGDSLIAADRVFGTFCDSPLYRADFYSKNIPVIRITDSIFTLGTNQPQFSTIDDVRDYYRDEERIEEIAKMCMFWIRKFYS